MWNLFHCASIKGWTVRLVKLAPLLATFQLLSPKTTNSKEGFCYLFIYFHKQNCQSNSLISDPLLLRALKPTYPNFLSIFVKKTT